ncbi:hypothetical protein Q9233_008051, partial [Columba guinea]
PITFSIQLEKVTSTMVQFSWKPQGGTRDSPYRVHLWGGSPQMKITLNESTAFNNLLSDHEYQISVDVSTCSKNVSTSLKVRTAAEVFNGTTRIINKIFVPEYQNKSSIAFKDFETKFINETEKHLPQKIRELIKGKKLRIIINSIENGSVIVNFDIVLDIGENVTEKEVSDAFIEALNMSTVLKADLKKTVIQGTNSCITVNSSEQITTVPPKSVTADSIVTTTFASGLCSNCMTLFRFAVPVSIQVQNVTAEAIQFSWTGGRSSSLYAISLMDGNRKINETTTKETKAVFKHLLPGYVYTISVAVLPCAENSWTSVSVRTEYQAFACTVLLKSQTFKHMLYNSDSESYKTMSENIKTEVSCCNLLCHYERSKESFAISNICFLD